jgi:hypothetical protein
MKNVEFLRDHKKAKKGTTRKVTDKWFIYASNINLVKEVKTIPKVKGA